ncbi:MAG: type II toxin-antitoxin system VapB family antitoxin [Lentisphaerota bacterium]
MATNLLLDDTLINQAVKIGHHRSKRAAVTAALNEYVAHKRQQDIKDLFGSMSFDESYDYKKARNR